MGRTASDRLDRLDGEEARVRGIVVRNAEVMRNGGIGLEDVVVAVVVQVRDHGVSAEQAGDEGQGHAALRTVVEVPGAIVEEEPVLKGAAVGEIEIWNGIRPDQAVHVAKADTGKVRRFREFRSASFFVSEPQPIAGWVIAHVDVDPGMRNGLG